MGERELAGRVALITGAAQGMGRAAAGRLAAAGAIPVLADLSPDGLERSADALRASGAEPRVYALDVADQARVEATVREVEAGFGRIDILVNAAGILRPTRFEAMTVAEWDELMNVNLRGTFLLMHAVYPGMKARGQGSIINFSSTAGLTVSTLGGAHYTASKHAVMGLTRAVAREGGQFDVRVNAVCPGLIDTEMVRRTIPADQIARYEAVFPIHRLGTPEEVAEAVLFLASDRSAYITGTALNISGGDLI